MSQSSTDQVGPDQYGPDQSGPDQSSPDDLSIDQVPSGVTRPARATKSRIRTEMVRLAFGRRSLLKGIMIGGMTVGVAGLDLFNGALPAAARPRTWWNCNDYSAASGGWDNGYWNRCNPCSTPKIGGRFCDSTGHHRRDKNWNNGIKGAYTQYYRRHYSCQNKNTWVWRIKNNRSYPNPRDRRCSDGRYRKVRASSGKLLSKGKTVCQHWMPKTGSPNDRRPINC